MSVTSDRDHHRREERGEKRRHRHPGMDAPLSSRRHQDRSRSRSRGNSAPRYGGRHDRDRYRERRRDDDKRGWDHGRGDREFGREDRGSRDRGAGAGRDNEGRAFEKRHHGDIKGDSHDSFGRSRDESNKPQDGTPNTWHRRGDFGRERIGNNRDYSEPNSHHERRGDRHYGPSDHPRGHPPQDFIHDRRGGNRPAQSKSPGPCHLPVQHHYRINRDAQLDDKLHQLGIPTPENEDPRGDDPEKRITTKAKKIGNGRNTESFDPASTLVRPDLRIWVGSNDIKVYEKKLKHDDVVIVPELFGREDNWDLYYKLVEEMRSLQKDNVKGSEWISWHEGAHLISKNPKGSDTFEMIIDKLCEYFKIRKESIGTRFNWYRDSTDWKPFHHDSAAYNPQRAKNQNITVGVSFGATRELAFLRALPQENGDKVRIYFPQTNNGVFSFGRDVNILWKHGVNALPESEQDGKGRISIILWGLADGVVEEKGSPPLLGSDGQGPHAPRRDEHRRGARGGTGYR